MDETETPEIKAIDALEKLRALITYKVNIKALSERFGVSRAHMSGILAGDHEMTEDMLKAVGVKRVVVYLVDDKPSKAA